MANSNFRIIRFEKNKIPEGDHEVVHTYLEQGFQVNVQGRKGRRIPVLPLLQLQTPGAFQDYEDLDRAITDANQTPGHTVAGPYSLEMELVITHAKDKSFRFKGIHAAWGSSGYKWAKLTEADIKLTFTGYEDGAEVDSFSSKITKNNFIRSSMNEDIDKLVISKDTYEGYMVFDNIKLQIT